MKHLVRSLRPGPDSVIGEELERITGTPSSRMLIAKAGTADAVAISGLSHDELHVLTREFQKRGGTVAANEAGDEAVLLGPLLGLGEVPGALVAWGPATESLGKALGTALMGRSQGPYRFEAGGNRVMLGKATGTEFLAEDAPGSFSLMVPARAEPGDAEGTGLLRLEVAEVLAADCQSRADMLHRSDTGVLCAVEHPFPLPEAIRAVADAVDRLASMGVAKERILVAGYRPGWDDKFLFRLNEWRCCGRPVVAHLAAGASFALMAVAALSGADLIAGGRPADEEVSAIREMERLWSAGE